MEKMLVKIQSKHSVQSLLVTRFLFFGFPFWMA